MKKISILLFFCCCTTLIGCRKSARNQRERYRSTEIVTESNRENSPIKEVRERRASSSQKKRNSKRSNQKLEGSQVFDRYGNAVFMIFTSDGRMGIKVQVSLLVTMDLPLVTITYLKGLPLVGSK